MFATRTRSSIPGVSTVPAGELVSPAYNGIASTGRFPRTAGALPGTAEGITSPAPTESQPQE